jgi:hypothetical protein
MAGFVQLSLSPLISLRSGLKANQFTNIPAKYVVGHSRATADRYRNKRYPKLPDLQQ